MKTRRIGLAVLLAGSLLAALGLLLNPSLDVHASEQLDAVDHRQADYLSASDASPRAELHSTVSISVTPAYTTYLPLISRPFVPTGIYGHITYQGSPVTNTQVELWRCDYNGTNWICSSLNALTTTTDLDGYYQFTSAPSLQVDQKYRVRFLKDAPGYLSWWDSFSIYTYTAGQTIAGGTFDVADITLLAPADGITATLPLHFQWIPRPATPSDSYQVGLVNYSAGGYWYSPLVGYSDSYTLTNPPPGFNPGVNYMWGIWAVAPDGGSGLSRQGRAFTVGSGSAR
jgi:hypothetical protein